MLDFVVEGAGTQHVDGVVVERGAVGIEAVEAGLVVYLPGVERHGYVLGYFAAFGDVYGRDVFAWVLL